MAMEIAVLWIAAGMVIGLVLSLAAIAYIIAAHIGMAPRW